MINNDMTLACIVAGGTGSRMGLDRPKQFYEIDGRPIIIITIEKFLSVNEIDKIYIGCHRDWLGFMNEQIARFDLDKRRIIVTEGGADRNGTVFKCAYLAKKEFPEGRHMLLTHDAVRPFVSEDIIRENIRLCREYGAVGTYVAATDTIVISKDGSTVESVPERRTLFNAQTPQTFMLDELISAYEQLDEKDRQSITDTCSVMTLAGRDIHIVTGDYKNIKITTIGDLDVAKAILKNV